MFYYQTFVNAVRGVGGNNTNRWLVMQGGGDTTWLNALPTDPTPNRLMVEYHNYTPSLFTINDKRSIVGQHDLLLGTGLPLFRQSQPQRHLGRGRRHRLGLPTTWPTCMSARAFRS